LSALYVDLTFETYSLWLMSKTLHKNIVYYYEFLKFQLKLIKCENYCVWGKFDLNGVHGGTILKSLG
jgi:hypothetical protein